MMYGKVFYANIGDGKSIGPFKRIEDVPEEHRDHVFTQWEDDEHYYVFKPDGTAEGPFERMKDVPKDVKGEVVGVPKDVVFSKDFRYNLVFEDDESDEAVLSIDDEATDLPISRADISMYSVFGLDGKFYGPYRTLDEVPAHAVGIVVAMSKTHGSFWVDQSGEWEYSAEMHVHRRRLDGNEAESTTLYFEPMKGRRVK